MSGWTNHSGMVTSLNMSENEMGNRGSKSILGTQSLNIVKEQRVDGSSVILIIIVRCILVAGENRFLVSILFYKCYALRDRVNSSIIKFTASLPAERFFRRKRVIDNPIKWQIRSLHSKSVATSPPLSPLCALANADCIKGKGGQRLNSWFVTGLIDAEGCFSLGLSANEKYKNSYKVALHFSMSLHEKDKDLLVRLKDFFGVGSVIKHGPATLQYKISSVKDLSILILHCNNNPLITKKRIDFELFQKAFYIFKNKLHLTDAGFNDILSIRASINLGLPAKLILAFPNILAIEKPSALAREDWKVQDPNWISGFTSGDGCFHVSLSKTSFSKTGYRVGLRFQLTQHNRDYELLKSLIGYLRCGRVEENLKLSICNYVVNNFNDITNIIIPFFDKYPIQGVKSLDFIDFKKIANFMKEKDHLDIEGIEKIIQIKSNMNKFRR
jgi:LAGLIDADG endonuclease